MYHKRYSVYLLMYAIMHTDVHVCNYAHYAHCTRICKEWQIVSLEGLLWDFKNHIKM